MVQLMMEIGENSRAGATDDRWTSDGDAVVVRWCRSQETARQVAAIVEVGN